MGDLHGGSIGNITAVSFTGTNTINPAGPRHTITASGSIGNIMAKGSTVAAGGLTDYIIAAGTDLGADRLFDGVDDVFTSAITVGTKSTAVSVGAITVKGQVVRTTIAAGVDPGTTGGFGIYGNGDDVLAARPAGFLGKTKIGALKFDTAGLGSLAFDPAVLPSPADAIEAQAIPSVLLQKTRTATTYLTALLADRYFDSEGSATVVHLIV
jgi:hypothetical protein